MSDFDNIDMSINKVTQKDS